MHNVQLLSSDGYNNANNHPNTLLPYNTTWININVLQVKLQCMLFVCKHSTNMSEQQSRSRMLDQTRQGCKFVSRELILLYCVSSVHVHPHATTHARLSGCSTPVMSRHTSSLSALSRHILDWDKHQLWMGRVRTQQTCIPSKAVMQHCRASSLALPTAKPLTRLQEHTLVQPVQVLRVDKHTLSVPSQLRSERDVLSASRRVQSHFDYQLCKHDTPLRNEERTDHKQV